MKKVKTILYLLFFLLQYSVAQPSSVKKTARSCFTLTTFKSDGSLLGRANGVFISSDGVGVSLWTPFIGADKAVVIDANGISHDVECLLGADEIYNLVKFRIKGSVSAASLASVINKDQTVWVTPTPKTGASIKATVTGIEKFKRQYNYSLLSSSASEQMNGAAVVDDKGKVLGLFSISSSQQCATDVRYVNDFKLTGLSQNDNIMRTSSIRIGLPDSQEEALVALVLSSEKPLEIYKATIQDFINKFPKAAEGYNIYANKLLGMGDIVGAEKAMREAIKNVSAKDEAHFNYARNMYLACVDSSLFAKVKSIGWSLDKAKQEAEIAYSIKPMNIYKHLQAQIIYSEGDYNKAYAAFEALTKTDIKNPELYLEMAQSKQHLNASDEEILRLLNQSVELCDTPYVATSAPYFFVRGQQLQKMGRYRLAVKDYYVYENLNKGGLSSDFYYNREQCEVKAKMWQQAIQDIAIAARLDPKEVLYPIEAANLLLRIGKYDVAKNIAKEAIKIDPKAAEAYLILGISQCELKEKTEGVGNIIKAKELGNKQADSFLKKYK